MKKNTQLIGFHWLPIQYSSVVFYKTAKIMLGVNIFSMNKMIPHWDSFPDKVKALIMLYVLGPDFT